jgi:SAM-dependent methyltransferase
MHKHVQAFIETAAQAFDLHGPVYEFGYCATERPVEELVCSAGEATDGEESRQLAELERIPLPDASARTVLCLNALEHVFEPARAMDEMLRILAPGSLLLICSASDDFTGRPGRYWQLTPQSLQRLLEKVEATLIGWHGPDHSPHTVLAIGCKPPVPDSLFCSINDFMERFRARLDEFTAERGWWERFRWWLANLLRSRRSSPLAGPYQQPTFLLQMPLNLPVTNHLLTGHHVKPKTGGRMDCTG